MCVICVNTDFRKQGFLTVLWKCEEICEIFNIVWSELKDWREDDIETSKCDDGCNLKSSAIIILLEIWILSIKTWQTRICKLFLCRGRFQSNLNYHYLFLGSTSRTVVVRSITILHSNKLNFTNLVQEWMTFFPDWRPPYQHRIQIYYSIL